ncbi:hypothetical protein IKB17_03895, partial [bacterium]|nr:hypothetical protein [bacterium]
VPGFAGATASTEFEFLTGMNIYTIDSSMPDVYKTHVTSKLYSLVDIFNSIVTDPRIFKTTIENNGSTYDITSCPLYDTDEIKMIDSEGTEVFKSLDGKDKICSIIMEAFDLEKATSCKATAQYSDANFTSNISFTNKQGVQFSVYTNKIDVSSTDFIVEIAIDINGNELPNCIYDDNKPSACKKPDRFIYLLSVNGHIQPSDTMGQAYIKTRSNFRNMDYDDIIHSNSIERKYDLDKPWNTKQNNKLDPQVL